MLLVARKNTDRILRLRDRKVVTEVNTTALNRNFIVRLRYIDKEKGRKINRLITGKQFAEMIGARSISKIYNRVWSFTTDKLTISLRRGIKFEIVHR